jgi:hypothetical protein
VAVVVCAAAAAASVEMAQAMAARVSFTGVSLLV